MPIITSKTIEPAKYHWNTVNDTPHTTPPVQRRGNGKENWVGLSKPNARGQYDCHISIITTLHQSLSLTSLKQRFVNGLLKQRFEPPDIASQAFWGEEGELLIRYTCPSGNKEAKMWAKESVQLCATSKTALDLRRDIAAKRKLQNQSSKFFTIYILADIDHCDQEIAGDSRVEFLVHLNHVFWDGISARYFVGDLLRSIGQDLEGKEYAWGHEIDKLSPPLPDALKVDLQTLDQDYDDSLEEFVASMSRFGTSVEPGLPSTAILKLTPSECHSVIQGIKSRFGPGLTITHLAQAATLRTLLHTNPLPRETLAEKRVIMPLPVNGRRYLRPEFADVQYGSFQACAVVEFEHLEEYTVDFGNTLAVLEALERGMKVTKKAYDYWLNKPFLLPLGLAKDNFLSAYFAS
ncbi:15-O-acetyltransferase Tri3 [Aureobasidium subglaciale]|nr:15-O-acetyltransferase Tri3 [Aureobasidium subglaciale]